MKPTTVRKAERTAHLAWALLLALYIYGLLPSWEETVLRWVATPALAASGFAMWFAAPLRRFWRRTRPRGRAPLTLGSAPSPTNN